MFESYLPALFVALYALDILFIRVCSLSSANVVPNIVDSRRDILFFVLSLLNERLNIDFSTDARFAGELFFAL